MSIVYNKCMKQKIYNKNYLFLQIVSKSNENNSNK